MCLREWLGTGGRRIYSLIRPHLRLSAEGGTESREGILGPPPSTFSTRWLLLNSRLVPSDRLQRLVEEMDREPVPRCVVDRGQIALVAASPSMGVPAALDAAGLTNWRERMGLDVSPEESLDFYAYPHDVIRFLPTVLAEQLHRTILAGEWSEPAAGVFVAKGVAWPSHVATDTTVGPIVIHPDVLLGAFCSLVGPLWIGAGARICDHATLRGPTAVGRRCKIGGEVEASVVEDYSNKGHYGYLGHSYVGSWVNLGAGTTCSNLKHSYGEIRVDYGTGKLDTGMQFLGTCIGDYARTSIQCGLQAGKVLGVGACGYGMIMEHVPPFVNYARQWGSVSALDLASVIRSVDRMFARRQVTFTADDGQLLRAVYDATQTERAGLPIQPPRF